MTDSYCFVYCVRMFTSMTLRTGYMDQKNDTRASVDKEVSGKRVKLEIWGELSVSETHIHLGACVQRQKKNNNKWLYALPNVYQSTHGFVCARK